MIKLALIDNGIPYHMRNNRKWNFKESGLYWGGCDSET